MVFEGKKLSQADLPEAVRASTSMPFAFPHVYMDDRVLVDGGSVWNVDFSSAVSRCKELVGNHPDRITVDIILLSGEQLERRDESEGHSAWANHNRFNALKSYYSVMSDVDEAMRAFPDVHFRYLIVPDSPLPSGTIPLDFKPQSIQEMMERGYKDALNAIREGRSFDKVRRKLTTPDFTSLVE